MIAEILSTGDEIRSGALIDSNSAYIAQRLEEIGFPVLRHTSVGDDVNVIVSTLKEIGSRSDVAVVTGGLGPTTDDLTAEAAAKAAGVELKLDEVALSTIERFFKRLNRPMSETNRKQAMLPEGSERLDNPIGTAPGFMLKVDRCHFFFLPGVPAEMRLMLSDKVLPRLVKLRGIDRSYFLVKTISTFGLPESTTGEKLADLTSAFPDVKLGLRAKFPEIQIKLYVNGDDEKKLNDLIEKATEWVLEQIGNRVFATDGSTMEEIIGRLIKEKKATLAIGESCTGGLISHWLTNVSGSSDYFLFSGVAYSNEAKINVLGVSRETLERYGAVHEETVKEMAEGARRVSGATYGIATSGIAGPDGGTEDKPVGTVCIGVASPMGVEGRRFFFPFGERTRNKQIFAMTALDLLRRELMRA
ncbi:MAG: competence/damage-inducible protein A [Deltaproteobacteria bacterium]|nr:competence/damage-inducible protein A [Deltaproteobacteria bacterium]